MNFFSTVLPGDNVVRIVILLLRELRVKVTDTTVRDTLLSNPHHPSLLSISDSLRRWRLDSLAIKTSAEKLQEIPCPFIVHMDDDPGSFVIVKKITPAAATCITDKNEWRDVALAEFAKRWNGLVLMVEKKEESGEVDYPLQKRKEYWKNHRIAWSTSILLLLGLVQIILNSGFSAYVVGSFIINSAGVVITTILLWYEYDLENPFMKKFCSVSATADCATVLFSKGGKLFNIISWSEIGFIYFTGGLFYQLFATDKFYWLVIISLPAAAYIFYSLAWQGFVIRKWCPLCLLVQVLLLVHLVLAFLTGQISAAFAAAASVPYIIVLSAYVVPALFWFVLKPYLYEAREKKNVEKQLIKIKSSRDVFDQLLRLQAPMKPGPGSTGIILGDPNAPNILVKVCSPYCDPCARTHPEIDRLLEKGNWKVQVIFTTGSTINDRNVQAAAYLLSKAADAKALSRWYSTERHYALPVSKETAEKYVRHFAAQLEAMYTWCVQENIQVTPTIYVNGHRLPEQYNVDDLSLFI